MSASRRTPVKEIGAVILASLQSLQWVLDVTFKEDLSRLRRGHGARNMALVRRLAFNILRAGRGKRSINSMRS